MHENLFSEQEKVTTNMGYNCSEYGERLSILDIKEWLMRLNLS